MKKLVSMMVPKSDNNVVLDPFAGSGTTLLAAQELGIPFLGMESTPHIEIARKRLGMSAIDHALASGRPETLPLFAGAMP